MESHKVTESSHLQKRIWSDKSPQRIGYIPICRKCGKPMKLESSDYITGNKQSWCCPVCFNQRIINPSLTIGKVAS